MEDDLLKNRAVATTQLGRVAEAQPTATCELALPLDQQREGDVFLAGAALASQRGEFAH